MTSYTQRLRKIALVCALVVTGIAATATNAFATHFRYGTITWQVQNPNTPNVVTIRFDSAWRWSYPWSPTSNPPLGTVVQPGTLTISTVSGPSYSNNITINLTVTSINSVEDWFAGSFVTTVTLPAQTGSPALYNVSFSGGNRISTLAEGNADQFWLVQAGITVPALGGAVNQPPTSSTVPIVVIGKDVPATFALPYVDPNAGDTVTFRFSTPLESSLANVVPGATQGNPATLSSAGIFNWTPHVLGLYATQARLTDQAGAFTVVDFLVSVINPVGPPPTVFINGQNTAQSLTVTAGTPVTFPVSATPGTVGHSLLLSAGTLPIGSTMSPALPVSSTAPSSTFTWNVPTFGNYVLNFSASDTLSGQDTNSMSLTVNKASSDVTVVTTSPSVFGAAVTFMATVHPHVGSIPATGFIQFTVDGSNIGSPQAVPSNGIVTASLTSTALLTGGDHTIGATYPGDNNLSAGSATTTHHVNPVATTTNFTPTAPWTVGQMATLTAQITLGTGLPVPAGSVEFFDGMISLGVGTVDASGFAHIFTNTVPGGTRTFTAVYSGTPSYSPSSGTRSITFNKTGSSTTVGGTPNPSTFGDTVTVTATVTGAPGITPTGSVTFLEGSTTLGTSTLVNGVATLNLNGLSVTGGTSVHTITASYGGDASYNSSSNATPLTVNKRTPTVVVTSSPNPSNFNNAVTITAVVTGVPQANPTGSFQLFVGSQNIQGVGGAPFVVNTSPGVMTVTFSPTNTLNVGSIGITVQYASGSPSYDNATGTMTHVVNPPAAPPFSQPLPIPPGACICTPDIMNVTGQGSQHWFAKAGGSSMTITASAIAVNSTDPETVTVNVFDSTGTTQIGSQLQVQYNAGQMPGSSVSGTLTVPTTAGDVYRVVVATPGTPPSQPHYRLKFDGASEAAMGAINALESHGGFGKDDPNRYYFNVGAGEDLGARIIQSAFIPNTQPGTVAQHVTLQVFDMANPGVPVPVKDQSGQTVTLLNITLSNSSNPPGPAFTIPFATIPSSASVYEVLLLSADGHYRINRVAPTNPPPASFDSGIYLSWNSAGRGSIRFHVDPGASFGGNIIGTPSAPEGYPLDVDDMGNGSAPIPVGISTMNELATGHYHIVFTAPDGYRVTPASIDIDVLCDQTLDINLKVSRADTTTTITAPPITYGAANALVTVDVQPGEGTDVPGFVNLTVDGGAPMTAPLVNGSAQFDLAGPSLNARNHALHASYVPSNDLLSSEASGSLQVDKATPSINVTPYNDVYDGQPHTAAGSATGAYGESLSGLNLSGTTHTNAGTYNLDSWTFSDVTGNYFDADGTLIDVIRKSTVTVTVNGYHVVYDASSHTATGTATGVGGADVAGLDLSGTTHASAGHYGADAWTFHDVNGNYEDASGTVEDIIDQAPATITVTPYDVTYNAQSHTAAGTATGIGGVNLAGLVLTGTTHTNAGDYSDSWTFSDPAGNYRDASGAVSDRIAKANPSITVTPYAVTFDANAHTAAGSATGVLGEPLAGLNLSGTTHTNAGAFTDGWTFTDVTGNYANVGGAVNDSIAKAGTSTTLTTSAAFAPAGQTVTFTATVSGPGVPDGAVQFVVDGVNSGAPVALGNGNATLSTSSLSVGPHTVVAVYTGGSNHLASQSGPVSTTMFALTGSGNFVIGDGNAALNATVTFWSSQWETVNTLSGPKANASFKGFASRVGAGSWTTEPGASSNPPASIGAYIAVIVTSTDVKSGSTISGNTVRKVIVRTNGGYGPDPGMAGTGTIVAIIP